MQIDESVFPPLIRTERLLLRPMRLSDDADIFAYASDDEVTRFMIWPTHRSVDNTVQYINYTLEAYKARNHYDYAIELLETGHVIGAGGACKDLEPDAWLAEIGYVLNRAYWGKGYMPEAMGAFTRYLFENLDLHRVEAFHFIENEKSGRVMQKIGMACEGTQCDKYFIKGAYRTIRLYAMINPAHEPKVILPAGFTPI